MTDPTDDTPGESRAFDGGCFDVLVVGAGFGGLGAALGAAERGARVLLLERLGYPGGCASTFMRGGLSFEAGATLLSGLGPDGLFSRRLEPLGLMPALERLDPVLDFRTPHFRRVVPADRARFVADWIRDYPGHALGLTAFFETVRRTSDLLWPIFDDPSLLPPLTLGSFFRHLPRAFFGLPLARWIGRSAEDVLRRHRVHDIPELRAFIDAVCRITVQCGVAEAEALPALAALDYWFRGTAHVHGGAGALARALASAIERRGGRVAYFSEARAIRRAGARWRVVTRRGEATAPVVIANVLPRAAATLSGIDLSPRMRDAQEKVENAWGAAMLYVTLRPGAWPKTARHFQILQYPGGPPGEGRTLFASIADRDAAGRGTITLSTHVPLARWRALDPAGRAAYAASIDRAMRTGFGRHMPEWAVFAEKFLPASPRTFERFTGRPDGAVGGIPRRIGATRLADFHPHEMADGFYLTGDTTFPGQSALATFAGGFRLAAHAIGQIA